MEGTKAILEATRTSQVPSSVGSDRDLQVSRSKSSQVIPVFVLLGNEHTVSRGADTTLGPNAATMNGTRFDIALRLHDDLPGRLPDRHGLLPRERAAPVQIGPGLAVLLPALLGPGLGHVLDRLSDGLLLHERARRGALAPVGVVDARISNVQHERDRLALPNSLSRQHGVEAVVEFEDGAGRIADRG